MGQRLAVAQHPREVVERIAKRELSGGFSEVWEGSKNGGGVGERKKKALSAEVTGPATIFVALTWLSLVGVLPSRAQLRFTRQWHYTKRTS